MFFLRTGFCRRQASVYLESPFSIDTFVALIRADTGSPTLSCISRRDRVVMTAATGPIAVSMITSESTCSEVISLILPGILFRMLWLIWRSSDLEDENAMEKGRVSAYRRVGPKGLGNLAQALAWDWSLALRRSKQRHRIERSEGLAGVFGGCGHQGCRT